MSRVKQGGDIGHKLIVHGTPDSTLATALAALSDLGDAKNRLVTIADGYVFATAADGTVPNGRILSVEGNSTSGYRLQVHLFCLPSQNGTVDYFTPVGIMNIPYTGTLAYGDTIMSNAAAGSSVDDATTGGWGMVLDLDNPASGYADVAY
jgi:hypothetical protein